MPALPAKLRARLSTPVGGLAGVVLLAAVGLVSPCIASPAETWSQVRAALESEGPSAALDLSRVGTSPHSPSAALLVQRVELLLETRGPSFARRSLDSLTVSPELAAVVHAHLARASGDDRAAALHMERAADLSPEHPLDRWTVDLERAWVTARQRASIATVDSLAGLLQSSAMQLESQRPRLQFEVDQLRIQTTARFVPRDTTLARVERWLGRSLQSRQQYETVRARFLRARLLALFGMGEAAIEGYRAVARDGAALGAARHTALAQNYLGLTLELSGRLREAIDPRRQAASSLAALEDSVGWAHALLGLGWDLGSIGDVEGAVRMESQALDVWAALKNDWGQAQAANNLGVVYLGQSRWDEAERAFDVALESSARSGNADQRGMTLNNIGILRMQRGRPDLAIESYRELLVLHRERENRDEEIAVLNNLGLACLALGESGQARTFFKRSVELGDDLGLTQIPALNNLGMLDAGRGRLDSAESYFLRAQSAARTLGESVTEGETLAWLGWVARRRGDYGEALRCLERADSLQANAQVGLARVTTLLRLGTVATQSGQPGRALRWSAVAESLALDKSLPEMAASARVVMAEAWQAAGDSERSRAGLREAFAQWRTVRDADPLQDLEPAYQTAASRIVQAFVRTLPAMRSEEFVREALSMTLELQSRALARPLESGAGLDSLLGAERFARAAVESLRLRIFDSNDSGVAMALAEAETEMHALRREIQRRDPALARSLRLPPPSVDSVLAGLQPGQLVLDFVFGPANLNADEIEVVFFVLEAGQPPSVHRLGTRDELRRRVRLWMDLISRPSADPLRAEQEERLAAELGQALLGPAWESMQRNSQVTIVADGPLRSMPFAALRLPDGRRWVETHTVDWRLSLDHLAAREPTTELVEPRFDLLLCESEEISDIRTHEEVERLARVFEDTRRVEATGLSHAEIEGIRPWKDARIVHVASHGAFDPRRPWRSGLYARRASRNEEPVIVLQQADLARIDIDCDLVTLSACQMARAEDASLHASLESFSQALLESGARAVLGTSWDVDDAIARWYVEAVYRELAAGETLAEAVRLAQVELMQQEATRDPRLWAPWVVIGEGALRIPLQTRSESFPSWVWWTLSALFMGLAIALRAYSQRPEPAKLAQ